MSDVTIAGFQVENLAGDGTHVLTVFYRNAKGEAVGIPDKFSFSTAAKLKKFIAKNLLVGGNDNEENVP